MRQASAGSAVQRLFQIFVLLSLSIVIAAASVQDASANPRYAAYVLDANTGQVLFSRNADAPRYPASLTKIMTIYLLFEAIETGRISLSTPIPISARAAAEPPTKIGLRPGSTITVENAILSLVTRSANDIATAVGEFLAGSEANFAQMMTAKARQLGMNGTTFRNAHGLPNNQQVTTARDMAILGYAVREHFPQHYRYFGTRQFNFAGQRIGNHNRLLGRVTGVDGIKTGFIRASGFNLVTSVRTGGRSVVAVVMGGQSAASRDNHMAALLAEHLPRASTRQTVGTLVARGSAVQSGRAVAVASALPRTMPIPSPRPDRVAMAHAAAGAPAVAQQPLVSAAHQSLQAQAAGTSQQVVVTQSEVAYAPAAAARVTPPAPVPMAQPAAASSVDPVSTASTTRPSGWAVQVGSLASEAEARQFLSRTAERSGGIVSGAAAFTEPFTRNGTNYVRARFGGYASSQEAWNACNALKRKNIDCFAAEL